MRYAEIIVPLAVSGTFTYLVPADLEADIKIGSRVVVQFGSRKYCSGIVYSLHNNKPFYETKAIESLLGNDPLVGHEHLRFWSWIAEYYMSSLGEVYAAAVPTSLRIETQTRVKLKSESFSRDRLSDTHLFIVDLLRRQKTISIGKIAKLLGKNPLPLIKLLIDKGVVEIYEHFQENFKPKFEKYIELNSAITNKDIFNERLKSLVRSPKQMEVLISFMALSGMRFVDGQIEYVSVQKKKLLDKAHATSMVLKKLVDKGILTEIQKPILRIEENYVSETEREKNLSEEQQAVLEEIKKEFSRKNVVLFYGVTGSGKTEIYIHLIKEIIAEGKQVLYLLPEIALTSQIIYRLRKVFGDKVGFYHSKFNDKERAEVYLSVYGNYLDKHYQIVVGVRSAIFLPFRNLGLIIVDEEHERTYKQTDRSPRYNARDSAVYLGSLLNAKVLLGSATPSVESYYNVERGKYGYVELLSRYGGIQLPKIIIADESEARKNKKMKSLFHPILLDKMREAFARGEQVILFRNRRGFAPYLECQTCGWVPKCKHCDVSLTYHSDINMLMCHYCGYTESVPSRCPVCGERYFQTRGFGTQKIETELSIFFPKLKIQRLDLDSTRGKHSYEIILRDFSDRKYDVLIGTQMVSKGLDFANVNLIGVFNVDNLLYFPDFRSTEHTYQLLMQVSGRAGRRDKRGEVIIQTSHPKNKIFKLIKEGDYKKMYQEEIIQRKNFLYPPFYRLIQITIKHKKEEIVIGYSSKAEKILKSFLGKRVYGAYRPVVSKIKDFYLREFMIKLEPKISLKKVKYRIREELEHLKDYKGYSNVLVSYNVDP